MRHWGDQTICGNRKKERKEAIHPRSTLMNTSLWAVINSWLHWLCVVSGQLAFLWLYKHSIAFYDQISSRWIAWLQIYCMLYWTLRYSAHNICTNYESRFKILLSFHCLLDPKRGRNAAFWRRGKMRTRFWWRNLRKRDHLEDISVEFRIILKGILKK